MSEVKKEKTLHFTDLINVEMLQQLQDAFSQISGLAILTFDSDGVAVTRGSGFEKCCKMCRATKVGAERCDSCVVEGVEMAKKRNDAVVYECHAGLMHFASPIKANGQIVGCFGGGQVFIEPPDITHVRKVAEELGLDPDEYEKAVRRVQIMNKERIERSTRYLYIIAAALSSSADKSYDLYYSNKELEKASRMKSDFLANMSHEIRTPMNAVLGLADLALREEMPRAAREYVHQIKASGKNLLVIINDILDFSKIESGKMDIIPVEYEPLSIIHDLASVINSRIGSKDIEFTIEIPPNIPKNLYGDNVRLHQIILNLLTNAVKFTQRGEVHLKMEYEEMDADHVLMKVAISDTGIGIKKTDMKKLFSSFQQVDSKRNRNVEGTGLGLAISQQLLYLMGGNITVESEYNKGTTFRFEVPQKIIDGMAVIPQLEKPLRTAVLFENPYVKAQLIRDLNLIGAEYVDLADDGSYENLDVDFFIVGKMFMDQSVQDFVISHPDMQCLVLVPYDSIEAVEIPNVRVLSKPVYSLSLYNAMGIQDIELGESEAENDHFSFIAPEANVLIVDDNPVNLTVASGLLEPLEMNVTTAISAAEAIDLIHKTKFDIIFMDHMMPEVDGIEATRIIRRLVPSYNDVPIIALTANAVGGAREMFIKEGMNDFVAKPIDLKDIVSKIRKWLPKEKIVIADENTVVPHKEQSDEQGGFSAHDIKELNIENALHLLGTEKLFLTVLKDYFGAIDKKAKVILEHKAAGRWRDYTIEVHSLKSTSRQIGADSIADVAAEMEKAGNEGNIELINQKTDGLIADYLKLRDDLKKYFGDTEKEELQIAKPEDIADMLGRMREALDNFDTLQMDEVMEEMSKYRYSDEYLEYFDFLKQAVSDSDIDNCLNVVVEWEKAVG